MKTLLLSMIAAVALMFVPTDGEAKPWRYRAYYGGYYDPYYGGGVIVAGPRVHVEYGGPRYYYRGPYRYYYYW